jgi:hypothetical protein
MSHIISFEEVRDSLAEEMPGEPLLTEEEWSAFLCRLAARRGELIAVELQRSVAAAA